MYYNPTPYFPYARLDTRPPVQTNAPKEQSPLMQKLMELPIECVNEIVGQLIQDPVLKEVSSDVLQNWSQYDVDKLIALEQRKSSVIILKRNTGDKFVLTITPETTVEQLKQDIKKVISEKEEPNMKGRKISWKYVWSCYCLMWKNVRLLENNKTLREYGLQDGDDITFAKYKPPKRKVPAS